MYSLTSLVAGDSVDFATDAPSYPASAGWTLKYRLTPRFTSPSQEPIEFTATTYEVDRYRVQVTSGTASAWEPGEYGWSAWVEKVNERVTLLRGTTKILVDPAEAAQGTDMRSQAVIALAEAKAAFAAWTPTKRSYRIGDREMEFSTAEEILSVIAYWEGEARNEELIQVGNAARASRRKVLGVVGRV